MNIKEFLKSNFFIKFIYLSNFLPKKYIYQIFKNSYRLSNYSVCQKAYNILSKKKKSDIELENKIFITILVIFEENLNQKKN